MNHYLWWVPLLIIKTCVATYLTVKNNADTTVWYQSKWFWLTFAISFGPTWAIVSRVSNRLVFDGMLYDTIIVLSFPACMIALGMTKQFTLVNYIGLTSVAIGLILLKLGQ